MQLLQLKITTPLTNGCKWPTQSIPGCTCVKYAKKKNLPTRGKTHEKYTQLYFMSNIPPPPTPPHTHLKLIGIYNTKFEDEIVVLSFCLCLCEKVCQLKLGRHIVKSHNLIMHMWSHVRSINTNVLGEFMFHRIPSNINHANTINGVRSWCRMHHIKILKEPPKLGDLSYHSHHSP